MAHDVFVSYPSEEKATADATIASLEASGIRCWIAPRDIPPGADWAGAIIDAISRSRLMVLIFSDATNDSDHVLREVRAAADASIPILPFRLTRTDPSPALQYYIGGTHWLDALTPDLETHLEHLASRTGALLTGDGPDEAHPARVAVGNQRPGFSTVGLAAVAVATILGTLGIWLLAPNQDDTPVTLPSVAQPGTTMPTTGTTTPIPSTSSSVPGPAVTNHPTASTAAAVLGIAIEFAPSAVCTLDERDVECVAIAPEGDETFHDVAVGDVDGDGQVDVVFAVGGGTRHPETWEGDTTLPGHNTLCRVDAEGMWECEKLTDSLLAASGVSMLDTNRDGTLDLVVKNHEPGYDEHSLLRAEVCLGDGDGGFTCSPLPDTELSEDDVGGSGVGVNGTAFGDLDGDGSPDVVLAGWMTTQDVCFGNGDGSFSCQELVSERDGTFMDAAIGDLDGDLLPDIVFASARTPARWCRGLGDRSFDCVDLLEPFSATMYVAIGDVDGEGTPDVVFGRQEVDGNPGGIEVCLGPVVPGKLCEREPFAPETVPGDVQQDAILEDLNADGQLDLLYIDYGSAITICLGVGRGEFTCDRVPEAAFALWDDRGFRTTAMLSAVDWVLGSP